MLLLFQLVVSYDLISITLQIQHNQIRQNTPWHHISFVLLNFFVFIAELHVKMTDYLSPKQGYSKKNMHLFW